MDGAGFRAGMDRGQNVERADQRDVGIAREKNPHGVGIASHDDFLHREIAEPTLLLRDVERQAKRGRRTRKDHLDLRGGGAAHVRQGEDKGKYRRSCRDAHPRTGAAGRSHCYSPDMVRWATCDSIESWLNWSKDQCLVESPIWIHCGYDIPEMMFSGSNPDNPSQH